MLLLNGTPRGIRIPVYTVKGCCPRPLDDGGLDCIDNIPKAKFNVNRQSVELLKNFLVCINTP